MTPEEREAIRRMGREAAERGRREKGLPLHVTDPEVLDRIAVLFGGDRSGTPESHTDPTRESREGSDDVGCD